MGRPVTGQDAAAGLEWLCEEYFTLVHTRPVHRHATRVAGFDALVPDPSREGAARGGVLAPVRDPAGVIGR
jgi:hypothetical protein